MPRRRRRTTGWQPQGQRRLRIRGIRRDVPDARKLSRAFIGLARAEAETRAQAEAEARAASRARAAGDTSTTGAAVADTGDAEDGDDPL